MLIASIILFALAAVSGALAGALRVRRGQNPGWPVALLHGALAAIGLVLLWVHAIQHDFPTLATISAVLFVVAALGGFALVILHLKRRLLPLAILGVHALVAVAGFVLLLAGVLS